MLRKCGLKVRSFSIRYIETSRHVTRNHLQNPAKVADNYWRTIKPLISNRSCTTWLQQPNGETFKKPKTSKNHQQMRPSPWNLGGLWALRAHKLPSRPGDNESCSSLADILKWRVFMKNDGMSQAVMKITWQ